MERVLWVLLCLGCASVRSKAEAQSGPWYQDLCSYKWEAIDQDNSVSYSLKLCESSPNTSCGPGAAVCAHSRTDNTDHTIGELSQIKVAEYVVDFNTTEKCPISSNNFQASISFQCGKTMGTPEFVASAQCVHYFEWRTYVACKKDKFKPHKEVPCYVFGSKGKHDLNPLIKVTSAYLVDDGDDNIDFYINICRSLDLPEKSCPQGSAACLVTNQGAFDMGSPTTQLELLSNDRLRIQYVANGPPPEMCNPHAPTVNITFICPSSRNAVSPPKMIAETNCRYEVEWVTEYACHRDYLESRSCKFTSQQHDISIDLSPLTRSATDVPYHAFSGQKDSPESYDFYMNVCGPVHTDECGNEEFISNCQVKKDGIIKKVAGRYQNQTLRYSDGDLTLIYPDGTKCSTGFQRMTVINFECNKSISGQGNPVYAGETDCTYYFDWETPYACVKEKEDLMCSVLDGKKHYDLSPLTRFPESDTADNWEVVDAKAENAEAKRFYLNVCHKIIQTGGGAGCPEDAAVCAKDTHNKTISLGSFLSSPQKTKIGNDIRLVYTDGDVCSHNARIQSILTLKCKPGDVESAPVLRSVSSGGCVYEFEWYTAAACVLSKTQGDNCKVQDPHGGFSFDLSPLSKPNAGYYNMTSGNYDYYINVCGPVTAATCPVKAGACQSDKSRSSWSLGEANSHLSYYNGLIQLTYSNGSQYNNKQHTLRSTLVSFLCDPQAGVGKPEFQVEDDYTYNFRWYTSYACPERPHECLVTDPKTLEQYDLSSLSRSSGNWLEMDLNDPASRRKYYINVCRPINPVQGCDRHTSVCQMKYVTEQGTPREDVSISNMGVSKRGPIIEGPNRLLLEFTEGSECISDGIKLNYTTHIHLECFKGTVVKGPRFMTLQNCTARFIWQTRAACAIKTTTNSNSCSILDPNTGFEFNLQPLASKTGYKTKENGKEFLVNICSDVSECGEGIAGCVLEDERPVSLVGVEKTLQYSTDGLLSLTYKGKLDETTATRDTFIINFVCNRSAHSGTFKLLKEYMSSNADHTVHDVLFEFGTALACVPAPVSCRITDSEGNEYDLSHLSRDNEDSPWIPIDTAGVKSRKFYINVCRPLPPVKDCPAGPLGACAVIDGASHNLGYIQSSPQVAEDGSISIVYQNGDACGKASQYSSRIILQCADSPGSPMLDRTDDCEYVFVWRTTEACPIKTSRGSACRVQDAKSGFEFNLNALKGTDYSIVNNKYTYYLSICGGIQKEVCAHNANGDAVSSCQVDGPNHKIAGLENQVLTYVDGQIILNYTNGEKCHKIYQRSTEIYFSCDPSKHPGNPEFINETPDCTYMFTWPTALACIPVKTTSCSYNDGQGRSYDLSSLAMDTQNWEAEHSTGGGERFYINVCRSLVPQGGSWKCPSSAASCMQSGDKYVSLGQVVSAPTMEGNILKLRYTNGQTCSDGKRQISTTINLQCDKDRVDSRPSLITVFEDCEFHFHWLTAAACPLNSAQQEGCKVTNPSTGYLFDLNSLTKVGQYTVRDSKDHSKSFLLNVCGNITSSGCKQGSAVCIKDGSTSVSGGQVSRKLWYKNGLLELKYEGGDDCPANTDLKHSTIIQFICSSAASEPALIESNADTCTHYFSFHTPLVCDHLVSCAVQNGSSLIDLTPLIHWNGYYTATDDAVKQSNTDTPDFYINICRPLNPIPGVSCPTGSAVCMDPDNGPPIDIGQETSGPQINVATDEVFITYSSGTMCVSDPSKNYTSKIIFTCQRGLELGSPQMLRLQDCVYLFEWTTSLVCPDSTNTTDCQLTDSQLQFTFDLSALSEEVQVSSGPSTYYISACGSVKDEACKNSSVCEVTGSGPTKIAKSLGIVEVLTMDFKHEEQAILAQYGGGELCPQGAAKYQSSILFICDPLAGQGSPQLLPKGSDCTTTFQWHTSLVCPPKKECKLVSSHQAFDLTGLSSLTEPWKFSYRGDAYYINLCQGIHGGLTGCPMEATVCRRLASGATETLGRVYTQTINHIGEQNKILISYTAGDKVCGNGLKAKTVVELSCSSTVGHPTLTRFDQAKCEFVIGWETRSACAVKQQEVKMENGIIHVPETGVRLSLGALYFSHHQASGDIRTNGDRYIYHIQLSGITNSSLQSCLGANICQVKLNAAYRRKIGSSSKAKYYVEGANLDVYVPSKSECLREKSKTVSSTIMFRCNPSAGLGIPEFRMETDECEYLFMWHTDAICGLTTVDPQAFDGGTTEAPSLSGHSRAVAMVLGLMLIGLTVCMLGLVLYKRERRELVIQKVASCCRRGNQVSYKYSKVNVDDDGGEEEMEWLMEDLEAPPTFASHRGRAHHHGNGHITTKHVNTDGLRSFSLDEQDDDSEDEVLNVPGVRVVKSNAPAKNTSANRSALLQEESDEDLVGLLDDSDRRRKSGKMHPFSLGNSTTMADQKREDEDSDEDLLRV